MDTSAESLKAIIFTYRMPRYLQRNAQFSILEIPHQVPGKQPLGPGPYSGMCCLVFGVLLAERHRLLALGELDSGALSADSRRGFAAKQANSTFASASSIPASPNGRTGEAKILDGIQTRSTHCGAISFRRNHLHIDFCRPDFHPTLKIPHSGHARILYPHSWLAVPRCLFLCTDWPVRGLRRRRV